MDKLIIEDFFKKHFNTSKIKIINHSSLSGGCINEVSLITMRKDSQEIKIVLKENRQKPIGFFEKEFDGLVTLLEILIQYKIPILVPRPIAFCQSDDQYQFLAIEYIAPTHKQLSNNGWKQFGVSLAQFHQLSGELNKYKKNDYGWSGYNYIGSNKQKNIFTKNWVDFFRDQRLGIQIKWADENTYLETKLKEKLLKLCNKLHEFLPKNPPPSLLHGDLWSGNIFFNDEEIPVIYDPAVYIGDGITDLALTELFGGFPNEFYQGYHQISVDKKNLEEKKTIYNLYHLLNHLNLFGRSYLSGIENSLNRLLY